MVKDIDVALAHRLVSSQFPEWKNLPIRAVKHSGWDNRTFHLGEHMLIRLPSADEYAAQVDVEQQWLPKLAPLLSLQIPEPLAIGMPGEGYPWKWSIYRWIEGKPAAISTPNDLSAFAKKLAQFLLDLESIDTNGGPPSSIDNFYRGASLANYDSETRKALENLKDKININLATEVWEKALASEWQKPPVWVHGDMSASNLIIMEGKLIGVIDFGQLCIGDPACDLVIAWTVLDGQSRKIFRKSLPMDEGTWARGRGWALWKALISASDTNESAHWHVIEEVLKDHKHGEKDVENP